MHTTQKINRLSKRVAAIAMVTVMLCSHVASASQAQRAPDGLTIAETAEVKSVAKRFTKQLYKTKDVAVLIDEFFVKDFLKHASPLDDKARHAALYAQLSDEEQQRLYVAAINWMYYGSLSVISKEDPNGESSSEQVFEKLFTSAIAEKLAMLEENFGLFADADEDGHADPARPEQLREFLPKLEGTLIEARDYLRHLSPKQTPVLTRESIRWENDDAYGMKKYWDEDLPADAKAMQVFLPILLDIVLVKVDGQWRVWAMFSDGD